MTAAARCWLPDSALGPAELARAVQSVLHAWLADWTPAPAALSWQDDSPPAPTPDQPQNSEASAGVEVRLTPEQTLYLGLAIAGPSGPAPASQADRDLLRLLGEAAADDLAVRLRGDRRDGEATAAPTFFAARFTDGDPAFSIAVSLSKEAAIRLRRRHARPTPYRQQSLPAAGARATAMAPHAVSVGALVGTSRLPLHAVRELGVGDTILLGSPLDGAVAVTIDQRVVGHRSGRLAAADDGVTLTFDRPPLTPTAASAQRDPS